MLSLDSLYLSSNFLVFQSFYLFFGDFPSAPMTIGITVTFMIHIFLFLKQGQGT